MKREWMIFIVGVIAFFLPLLGLPILFKTIVFMILGLFLWVSALRELRKTYRRERGTVNLYSQASAPVTNLKPVMNDMNEVHVEQGFGK